MFCYEAGFNGNYVPRRASPDGVNINDPKTLSNLLRVSSFYQPDPRYLETMQQNHFTGKMRRRLTEWMWEISDVCEEGVLPHAVNILDRYLSISPVESPREELQLLGAVSLFLASKLREATPISVAGLCENGGYSYNCGEVRRWELKVLNALNWDTSAVLPHDLLDHFLVRLPIPGELKQRVTNHARTLINMCCTEYNFLPHSSIMMATGCLYDAVVALGKSHLELRRNLPYLLSEYVEIDKEELGVVHGKIRALMESNRNDLPPVDPVVTDDKPSPLLTPTDVVQLPIEMQ